MICSKVRKKSAYAIKEDPMESNSTAELKMADLAAEMDTIHFANSLYWRRGEAVTEEERIEYYRRQKRLDEIRAELAQLRP